MFIVNYFDKISCNLHTYKLFGMILHLSQHIHTLICSSCTKYLFLCAGSINLKSCLSVVALTEPLKNFKFVFDVCTTDRVYHLAADTEEDRTEWVNTLKTLLFTSQTVSFLAIL